MYLISGRSDNWKQRKNNDNQEKIKLFYVSVEKSDDLKGKKCGSIMNSSVNLL